MRKILKKIALAVSGFLVLSFVYFFIGTTKPVENIVWGVNFSQKQAQSLGLDWRENYLAVLEDLGVKNLRIAAYWDLLEPKEGQYDFRDLDWQIKTAEEKGARLILIVGMKTPRWPECHEPQWVKKQKTENRGQKLLEYVGEIVNRYKNSEAVWAWQVENEPLFPFGECPKIYKKFLKEEISLVRSLDPSRPVIISDSGEWSLWVEAARLGDIVGVTTYKKVWSDVADRYWTNFLPPVFYHRKAELVRKIFNKNVIGVELQAEPWGLKPLNNMLPDEQNITMNLRQFKYNIEFARKTGIGVHYLWGAEWWYWMKEKQNQPAIWEEARKLFQ